MEQSPEDRVAALERGMAALTERVERLEGEVLPRDLAGADEPPDPYERTMPLGPT